MSEDVAIEPLGTRAAAYVGEVVYIYAFDIAYEMSRLPIAELLGRPVAQFRIDATKRSPRQLLFLSPEMVHLAPVERVGPHGLVRIERTVKLLPLGAISITMRVPFAVQRLSDLVVYHDVEFTSGTLRDEVRQLAEEVRKELEPYCTRPTGQVRDEEAYTVFCLHSSTKPDERHFNTEAWLLAHRREVASLLTQEEDVEFLSQQEVEESTGRYLSYYNHDLVVIDWDSALVVSEPTDMHETLYIMELANLQLTELEAYDRILDAVVERSYRDLEARRPRGGRQAMFSDLREIRIDLARLSDELSNITKFFGDWHLARIYSLMADRFHLSDWYRSVGAKLTMLDYLYGLHKQDQNNRWMLILELTIVLLFVLDVVLLVVGPMG